MAQYTIELRNVIATGENIFDFSYPFYDETKRAKFESDFIKHFYFREIGAETVDRFKWYLQDKMLTVFPYYNKLFETAQIEYSVLDNYKLQENYTMTRENQERAEGESYTVGQMFGDQEGKTRENKTVDSVGNVKGSGDETQNETTKNETAHQGHTETDSSGSNHSETVGSGENNIDDKTVKKFLDTPQGRLDLDNSDYLTTLNQDEQNRKENTSTDTETNEDTQGHTETDSSESGSSDTVRSLQGHTENSTDTTAQEKTKDTINTTNHEEQKATQDNNTRTKTQGKEVVTFENLRSGNIGVDTDADMLQKHIKLQKILTEIERMFFDECEDLFMLVY